MFWREYEDFRASKEAKNKEVLYVIINYKYMEVLIP